MKPSYRLNIRLNYLFEFVKNLNLMSAFWPIFLVTQGMTLWEVGLLESIFHVTSLIMETPTGALADLYGRKFSRQWGLIAHLVYMMIFLFVDNFWLASIGFVFAAIGYNLESGSGTAFVYDSLKQIHETERFAHIESRREVVLSAAQVSGALLGGFVALLSFQLAYLATITLTLIALLLSLLLKETPLPPRTSHPPFYRAIQEQLQVSWKIVSQDRLMHVVMIFSAWIGAIGTTVYFYTTTYWYSLGWLEHHVGIGVAVAGFLGALIALRTPHLVRRFAHLKLIRMVSYGLVIGVAFMADPYVAVGGLVVISAMESILYVSSNAFFNERLSSEERATVLSYSSMLFSLLMIGLFPLVGLLIEWWNYPVVVFLLAGCGVVSTLIYSWIQQKLSNKKNP